MEVGVVLRLKDKLEVELLVETSIWLVCTGPIVLDKLELALDVWLANGPALDIGIGCIPADPLDCPLVWAGCTLAPPFVDALVWAGCTLAPPLDIPLVRVSVTVEVMVKVFAGMVTVCPALTSTRAGMIVVETRT